MWFGESGQAHGAIVCNKAQVQVDGGAVFESVQGEALGHPLG